MLNIQENSDLLKWMPRGETIWAAISKIGR